MKGKSDTERKQIIGMVVQQIATTAQQLHFGVAMENLDFASKKLTMGARTVNKRYNDMLSSLTSP